GPSTPLNVYISVPDPRSASQVTMMAAMMASVRMRRFMAAPMGREWGRVQAAHRHSRALSRQDEAGRCFHAGELDPDRRPDGTGLRRTDDLPRKAGIVPPVRSMPT